MSSGVCWTVAAAWLSVYPCKRSTQATASIQHAAYELYGDMQDIWADHDPVLLIS